VTKDPAPDGGFEFRYRTWVFFGLFWFAFFCYRLDHVNLAVALLHAVMPGVALGAGRGRAALQALFAVAGALGLAAAATRTWASAYLHSEIVHDTVVHTNALVADGPFRHVRNPLYLGVLLLMLGMSLLASRLGALVLVLGGVPFILRLIAREEAALSATQGEGYAAYRARVPRLVPSLAPRLPGSGTRPRWGQGFAGEAWIWIIAVSMAGFAVTGDSKLILYASTAGLVLYALLFGVWKRRAAGAKAPRMS